MTNVSDEEIYAYPGLIFDLDGTLIDSEPFHLKAWNEILQKYHLPPMDWDYIMSVGGISSARIGQMRLDASGRKDLTGEQIAKEKTELYVAKYLQEIPLFDGIAAYLKEGKKRGRRVAVATGSQLNETTKLLKRHGIFKLLDAIVSSDQVAHCKPAPDTYLEAGRRIGLQSAQCLVFEDTNVGLQGIKAAGMTALQVFGGRIISGFIKP